MSTLKQRFALLMKERPDISQADLARATGAKPPSVNDWFSGETKSMKAGTAAKAAQLYGCSALWLSDGTGEVWPPSAAPTEAPAANPGDAPDLVIVQYDTGGSMGSGFHLSETPPGQIKSWRVDHEWLRLNVPAHTGVKNLCIVTGFGPSMRPMFNPGDPLLLDRGVNVVDHDGVYFFRVGDEGFIKMIQRVPDPHGAGVMLQIISKNPDYPPYPMSPKNQEFEVLGKVLTVWRSEQH